ncbi:MAG: hypothetical protein C0404_05375 [Verrucomicrobia bacterium]|nr:hypothetical protein [Verrucomicrobiota bacterium]
MTNLSTTDVPQKKTSHRRKRRKAGDKWGDLESEELVAKVCRLFCDGSTPAEIVKQLGEEQIKLSREAPYKLITQAAHKGWIHYEAPASEFLEVQLIRKVPWLKNACKVVNTPVFDDVAGRAADQLLSIIKSFGPGKDAVHIGFAGGHAMRNVAKRFADLLRTPLIGMPGKLVFHALVAGFDITDTTTAPNTFFLYFTGEDLAVKTEFIGLFTEAVISDETYARLRRESTTIKKCVAEAEKLDIVVTSGTSWEDPDSPLKKYMESSEESLKSLVDQGCCGDILWRPISPSGPIEVPTSIRAMTILELRKLRELIHNGTKVLIALGPCSLCRRPKDDLLEALLFMPEPIITHLVVDSRSVRRMLDRVGPKKIPST